LAQSGTMKDLSIYFSPVSYAQEMAEEALGKQILVHDENGFPEITEKGVAILYVPEFRRTVHGALEGRDSFRKPLYDMFPGNSWNESIYDLGTIVPGESIQDTYFALSQVVSELVKSRIVPIIVGGGQDLTLACYKGFETLEQMINMCMIDSKLDVGEPEDEIHAEGFISQLLMQRPCYLFNLATVGVQRPFVSRREIDLFDQLYFDICRLGE